MVEVVDLRSKRIQFACLDDLREKLPPKRWLNEALPIRSRVTVEVAVEHTWDATVRSEEDEGVCQGQEILRNRSCQRLSFHLKPSCQYLAKVGRSIQQTVS